MIHCTDSVRVAAQAYYERTITPDNAMRGGLPLEAFRFTDFSNPDSVDTLEPNMIVLSHSAIEKFDQCAAAYKAQYITKEIKFVESVSTMYGNRGHKALEERLGKGTPLPDEFKELEPMCQAAEKLKGTPMVEKPLAITDDLKPGEYWSKQNWFRGKGDYIKLEEDTGYLKVWDWKFGKPKKDKLQLERMALICYYNFPGIKKIKVAFVYPKTGDVDTETFTDADIPDMLLRLKRSIERIEVAHKSDIFPPTPSGLCLPSKTSPYPGCQVSSCPFHKDNR